MSDHQQSKHGLTFRDVVLFEDEKEAFAQLQESLEAELQPHEPSNRTSSSSLSSLPGTSGAFAAWKPSSPAMSPTPS